MRRNGLMLAAVLLVAGLSAIAWTWFSKPTILRVAVGPVGSDDTRLTAGLVQAVQRSKGALRMRLTLAESPRAAAAMLDEGKVDLAVTRSDVAMPSDGLTMVVLRRAYAILIVRAGRGVARIADLRGKIIATSRHSPDNVALLQTIFDHYELPRDSVTITGLDPDERGPALRDGTVDAVFMVAPPTSRPLANSIAAMARTVGEPGIAFVPIREAEAIAARNRALEASELVGGAFGGAPPRPPEAIPTVSVTYRLMAHRTLSDSDVGDLTKLIINARQQLATELPFAQGIEAPSTEKNAPLPVHPGAAAYIDGEQETFFEKYGDWFYLGAVALSILGTIAAALISRARSARREEAMEGLNRLMAIIGEARDADSEERLGDLETEIDEILSHMLAQVANDYLDEAALSAYRIAMDQTSQAISERRHALEREEDAAPEGPALVKPGSSRVVRR